MFTKCIPAIALLLWMTACENGSPRPVDMDPADMCAWCKMAISEKRYAAQAIDNDGNAYKFDNAGCMTRFVAARRLRSKIAAYYIADYQTRSWLDARTAAYASSPAIPSPMGSGLAAFGAANNAAQFAAAQHGKVIAFEDLWTTGR